MTSFVAKQELKLVVVGDVGCGKENFIKKFLYFYPPFLEIRRDTDAIYLSRLPDRSVTHPFSGLKIKYTCNNIRLHNVNDMKAVSDPKFYQDLDVIFYCYASDDIESFWNLEQKWIPQLKSSKVQYSFIVANLSTQQDRLFQKQQSTVPAKKAKRLKKRFHLRSFVEHTDDYKKLFTILDFFLNNALSRLYRKRFPDIKMDTDNKGIENMDNNRRRSDKNCP